MKSTPTRKLIITRCEAKKSGTTNGRDWTLYEVDATRDGHPIENQDLVAFEPLPLGEEQEFSVERRERTFRGKVYTSYTIGKPRAPLPDLPSPEKVPAGRYAIDNEDGELRFYRVWRGTRKPEYVKVYVLHGPDDSELPFPAVAKVMAKIAQDPGAAAIRYGHELKHCCICNLRLTNHLSRELGIGPVCGGRFYDGAEWNTKKHKAREALEQRGINPLDSVDEEVMA